jgi:hypothetical protein
VEIDSNFFRLKKIFYISYNGRIAPKAIMFCFYIIAAVDENFSETNLVFKVIGKSDKTSIFQCHKIENTKWISVLDKKHEAKYLCKLMNKAELE